MFTCVGWKVTQHYITLPVTAIYSRTHGDIWFCEDSVIIIIIIRIIIVIIGIIDRSRRRRGLLDAVVAECVAARQGLGLVEDEITNRTLHRVPDALQIITRACHLVYICTTRQPLQCKRVKRKSIAKVRATVRNVLFASN